MKRKTNFITGILFAVCLLVFLSFTIKTKVDTTINQKEYIEIYGLVNDKNGRVANAIINLYVGEDLKKTVITNNRGVFELLLEFNKSYVVEGYKPGYASKKVLINTSVPANLVHSDDVFYPDFTLELVEKFADVNYAVFNQPVKEFVYDSEKWMFVENTTFSSSFTNAINALNESIKSQRKKEYNRYKAEGDVSYNNKDYEDAYILYTKADEYLPGQEEVAKRLKELRKNAKSSKSLEWWYNQAVQKADAEFEGKKYEAAKYYYNKAVFYNPKETYAKERLELTDSLLTVVYVEKKKQYDLHIVQADQFLAAKNFPKAIINYQMANTLLPDEEYPQQKLEELEPYIIEMKKKHQQDSLFDLERKKADEYFSRKEYENARNTYKKALKIRPEDSLVIIQLAKIDSINNAIDEQLLAGKKAEDEIRKNKLASSILDSVDKDLLSDDYEAAQKRLRRVLALNPINEQIKKRIDQIKVIIAELRNKKSKENLAADNTSLPDTGIEKKEKNEALVSPDKVEKGDKNSEEQTTDNKKVKREKYNIQELKEELKRKKGNKAEEARLNYEIAQTYHDQMDLSEALSYYLLSLEQKREIKDTKAEADILSNIAIVYFDSGSYETSISYYEEALDVQKKTGDKPSIAQTLDELGNIYENTFRYEKALDSYKDALVIRKEMKDEKGVIEILNKIGNLHYERSEYLQSIESFQDALQVSETLNEKEGIGSISNNLGVIYYRMNNYDEAIRYYQRSVDISSESGNKKNLSIAYNNIGNVNYDWTKYKEAIEYYEKSLEIKKELKLDDGIAKSMYNIGNAYLQMQNYKKALEYYNNSNTIALKINLRELIYLNYAGISRVYTDQQDYKKALEYYKLSANTRMVMDDEDKQVAEIISSKDLSKSLKLIQTLRHEVRKQKLLAEYEANKRQKEVEIKNLEIKRKQQQLQKQRLLLIFSFLVIVLIIVFASQLYKLYLQKKKANELITYQNQQITDSIKYASRIQQAILPPRDYIESNLPRHFILNKPRDIVSGDYYWVSQRDDESIIAVADCTGHGVPGAFMSILGVSFLNEIVSADKQIRSFEILNKLRDQIIKSLHQTGKLDEAKDGMDIALCIFNRKTRMLEFSGANNPLYLIRNHELMQIKPDKMPIGIHPMRNSSFNKQEISIEEGDVLYVFSDGFVDQLGGPNDKKFLPKRFKDILMEIHEKPLDVQEKVLDKVISEWKGTGEQTDDILVMGFRL